MTRMKMLINDFNSSQKINVIKHYMLISFGIPCFEMMKKFRKNSFMNNYSFFRVIYISQFEDRSIFANALINVVILIGNG